MKDKIRFIHCADVHLGANPYGIKERFNDMGNVFKEVIDFDERKDEDFPELMELKVDRGNIISNMIQRIKYTSKFAKIESKYVPVDFKKYNEVYVFCDSDPIGYYLSYKKIKRSRPSWHRSNLQYL